MNICLINVKGPEKSLKKGREIDDKIDVDSFAVIRDL